MAPFSYSQFHSVHRSKYARLIIGYNRLEDLSKSEVIALAVKIFFDAMPEDKRKKYDEFFEKMKTEGKLTPHELNIQTATRPHSYALQQEKLKSHQKVVINARGKKKIAR